MDSYYQHLSEVKKNLKKVTFYSPDHGKEEKKGMCKSMKKNSIHGKNLKQRSKKINKVCVNLQL